MDLFEREQQIYNEAAAHLKEIQSGAPCRAEQFARLTAEYGKVLKQFRKIVHWSDRTAGGLITDKNDLQNLSQRDALTGIYNRRFMEESLESCIEFLSSAGGALSVLMVDIDFFKKYNDTYGHGLGDICLKSVADTLVDAVRKDSSFVARYGGEEFIVFLPETDADGARIVADRLLARVRELNIPHATSDAAGVVTISIGIAAGVVGDMSGMDNCIKLADEALYISKQSGRNRYTCLCLQEDPK
jgi:diguanylate cyclase (GGDEF)-like protein